MTGREHKNYKERGGLKLKRDNHRGNQISQIQTCFHLQIQNKVWFRICSFAKERRTAQLSPSRPNSSDFLTLNDQKQTRV